MRWGLAVCVLLAWAGREEAQARIATETVECGALTADLNGNGVVDFDDFFILADQFGLTCVAPHSETVDASLPGGAQMEMVWIEPGTFTMGSPDSEQGRNPDEGPQHQVTISKGFYLGKYEITQWQWITVMGTQPWSGQDNEGYVVQSNPNNPAVYISWDDTQEFIHRLNEAAGDSLYRLPTEAEWEYACRAGTTTRWSFGDDESQLKDYAWYRVNDFNTDEEYAHAVGTKKPNPWGLYDMHGNVWKWVQDWYGNYSIGEQTDPRGPTSGSARVLRGGNFAADAWIMRSAFRSGNSPDLRHYDIGARLLRIK